LPGEEDIIGSYTFGRIASHKVEVPNRDLLVEFCKGSSLKVANTFVPGPPDSKATFIEPGFSFLGEVTQPGYNMLDLLLCDPATLCRIQKLHSVREAALGTNHYLVKVVLQFERPEPLVRSSLARPDVAALQESAAATQFAQCFGSMVEGVNVMDGTLSNVWDATKVAMEAAARSLPQRTKKANQPWISDATLHLIELRLKARAENDYRNEQLLHKEVRKAAKLDRTRWLNSLLDTGDWRQVRNLRKPRRARCGRLRDSQGELVESDVWAETMATHLERVQWRVRTAGLVDGPPIGEDLPVNTNEFTEAEVAAGVAKLRRNRASGPDDIPAEYWKCIADTQGGLTFLTDLCNKCWTAEALPKEWHTADVNMIHKKGSVEDCENYRPISLICVAYKLFASLLLSRLQAAGAEGRLTSTQFGFRRGCSTSDAIFMVRRMIDSSLAQRHGKVAMLALDWAKAFDAINVESMLVALQRFGLPAKILRMIKNIYTGRTFKVLDTSNGSSEHIQHSGISQGCPLSPFLFVMLMTIIMKDATSGLSEAAQHSLAKGSLSAVLYADDTLLISSSGAHLQEFLDSVAKVGSNYGLQLHWSKFQLLQVGGQYQLIAPDGTAIAPGSVMTYLGAAIYDDGGIKTELNRRLGAAWGEFSKLDRIWRHTSLSRGRKISIYQAVVVSRLLYALSSAWLNVAEVRRLNGFHCRCLRAALQIKPAYYSRVSNASVLRQASCRPLGNQLLEQQLLLYGRIARGRATDPLRSVTFHHDLEPATAQYIRRVGRPRNEWAVMLRREAFKVSPDMMGIIHDISVWRRAVKKYCMG